MTSEPWPIKEQILSMNYLANVMHEVIFDTEHYNNKQKREYYSKCVTELIQELNSKHIDYSDLRKALIPPEKDYEIAFIFDSCKFDTNRGYILDNLAIMLPIISKWSGTTYSIMGGDLIPYEYAPLALSKSLIRNKKYGEVYEISNYFAIYFNNLTKERAEELHSLLLCHKHYCGYADVTHYCLLKMILANSMVPIALVSKRKTIVESTAENDGGTNNPYYDDLCKFYTGVIVSESNYSTFLTYRIPSPLGYKVDAQSQFDALHTEKISINAENIVISEDKIEDYLKDPYHKHNHGKHKKWSSFFGTEDYNVDMFKELFKEINLSNIYNLRLRGPTEEDAKIISFNVIGDAKGHDNQYHRVKVSFKYDFESKMFYLVTIF